MMDSPWRRDFSWRLQHLRLILLLLLIPSSLSDSSDDFDEELYSVVDSAREESPWTSSAGHSVRSSRSIELHNVTDNRTFSDNSLWNDLWYECSKKATFKCVRSGVFKYLDKSLEMNDDVEITDQLLFTRNRNKLNGFCENSEEQKERCVRYEEEKNRILSGDYKERESSTEPAVAEETEEEDEDASPRSVDSLGDVSGILYDKGTHFLMSHDLELRLPQLFFGGGSVKIQPKGFVEDEDGEGTMVKIVFKPPASETERQGRFLFSHIKKLFKKKLMHSFMALLLVIKMIKVKLMFLLPMVVGQSTAKRLLLKALLFLIPGLAHLFKLCHYYHLEHAKYHHHHHKIKHHHHHVQIPVPVPVPIHHEPVVHHHVEPSIHHIHDDNSYPGGQDFPPYAPSNNAIHGPTGDEGYEYPLVSHQAGPGPPGSYSRGEYSTLDQYKDNEVAMASWGLGTLNYEDAGVLDAKDQPYTGYENDNKLYKKSPVSGYQQQYYSPDVGFQTAAHKQQQYQQQYLSKLQALSAKPSTTAHAAANNVPVVYDPFYSPILQKIDNIFVQLGFNDEACRERLVCSMYKTPQRFSPHSNLLSAQLSRDSSDLQKPYINNSAVIRFYKYVQAAREGQDQRDCLRLYPSCAVNTEG